jgi:penicillin-binding protein 2
VLKGEYENGKHDIQSVKGDDLYLTIDAGLQELAEKLLRQTGKSGAVVAIDPSTGGILAICSEPDFDLDILNGTTRKGEWADIALSPRKPLFNRAIQAAYPPGSTYKLLLSIAALEEGVITPEQTIFCPGYFEFGGRRFKCHGGAHGTINMTRAIAQSCNVYFYKLILQVGLEKWHEYGEMFGFGDREGIDLPGEKRGVLPSTEYYDKRFGEKRWTKGYLVSLGIGQGELSTTPLQLANFAATIANNGTWHQPHLVSGYRDSRSGTYVPLSYDDRKLPISQHTFDVVKEGMQGVVLQGTGTLARVPGVTVAGKTGTAQNPHGQDHAWFICFAPVDQPKIAITVLVENAGFGGSVSAPIARELINYYVNGKNRNGDNSKAVAAIKAASDSLAPGHSAPRNAAADSLKADSPEEDPGD